MADVGSAPKSSRRVTTDEPLYLDDRTIAKKLGIDPSMTTAVFSTLEKSGFPRQNPLFCDKRFWPAVEAFIYRREGMPLHSDDTRSAEYYRSTERFR